MNYAYAPWTRTLPACAWMKRRATSPSVGVVVVGGPFVTTQTNWLPLAPERLMPSTASGSASPLTFWKPYAGMKESE